jgi:hypothetical protein
MAAFSGQFASGMPLWALGNIAGNLTRKPALPFLPTMK